MKLLTLFNVFFILLFLTYTDGGKNRKKRNDLLLRNVGPISEHGKLCNALWRPHLVDPLNECELNRNNQKCIKKNYSCYNGSCCPSQDVVCLMQADSGHELKLDEHFGRYAFHVQINSCIKFSYFGNGGNFNNFLTFRDCIHYCYDFSNKSAA